MRVKSPFKSLYPSTPLVTLKPIDLINQFSATLLKSIGEKGCSVEAMLLKSAVTNTFVISLKDNREHAE